MCYVLSCNTPFGRYLVREVKRTSLSFRQHCSMTFKSTGCLAFIEVIHLQAAKGRIWLGAVVGWPIAWCLLLAALAAQLITPMLGPDGITDFYDLAHQAAVSVYFNVSRLTDFSISGLFPILAAGCGGPSSKEFPTSDITIIVPFSAGGGADRVARATAAYSEAGTDVRLRGVPMPGGGAAVGSKFVADAKADGYTLLISPHLVLVGTPLLRDVGYTLDDFAPICALTQINMVLAVSPDRTISSFREFCEMGGKAAIIISDGFAEVGRQDLEDQLFEISQKYDVVYIGPNGLGIIDNFSGLLGYWNSGATLP